MSRWKKSAAMIPSARAVRNSRQLGPVQRGAGSIPAACRICHTVEEAIGCPSPAKLALDSTMPPPRVPPRQAQHQPLERGRRGRSPSAPASSGEVPLPGDQPAVPGQQRPRRDRDNVPPAERGYQRRQHGQPQPVRGLVADRTPELPPHHRVLVPQHQQFGVLGGVPARQHRGNGQQPTSGLVQQRDDHPRSIPATTDPLWTRPSPAAMTLRAPQGRRADGPGVPGRSRRRRRSAGRGHCRSTGLRRSTEPRCLGVGRR